MITVKVKTLKKKILNQLDKVSDMSRSDYEKIIRGECKILGKVPQDILSWRNGTGYAIIVQKENTACLYPYFSTLRQQIPTIETIIID